MKNKGSLLFWILILTFLVGVFLFQYNTPKQFVWNPTYSTYDKQPFGSYVFDDVASSSIDHYSLENKTFYQLYQDYEDEWYYEDDYTEYEDDDESDYSVTDTILPLPEDERMGFLLTEQSVSFTGTDVDALLKLVKQGHKVMLCLSSFPYDLCDSLNFTTQSDSYLSLRFIERYAKEGNQRDSLFFGTDTINPEQIYAVYPHLHPIYIQEGRQYYSWEKKDSTQQYNRIRCDSLETLVWNKNNKPVVVRLFIGEGELFLVSTPLMFTNYGILDQGNASYAFRLLSYMKEMPVVRLEAYGANNQPSSTPFRYFLSQPTLRWALYMTFILIIIFMIFTAKRRQRIIPIVQQPANQTLQFTQLIGNLYFQKKDYKDLIQKKYLYFCTEVKRLNGLDLQSDEPDEELCRRLSDKMGLGMDEVWPGFRELKYLLRPETLVDETQMIRNIDRINEWMKYLVIA